MDMVKPNPSKKDKIIALFILSVLVFGALAYFTKIPVFTLLFNLLVFICGFWLFTVNIKSLSLSISSAAWVKTTFSIADTKLTMKSCGTEGHSSEYHPYFDVEYFYEGVSYIVTSKDNLNLYTGTPIFYSAHDARDYLQNVTSGLYGDTLLVNPSDPKQAFLRSGIARNQIGRFIFSVMLMVLPVLTMMNVITWH